MPLWGQRRVAPCSGRSALRRVDCAPAHGDGRRVPTAPLLDGGTLLWHGMFRIGIARLLNVAGSRSLTLPDIVRIRFG